LIWYGIGKIVWMTSLQSWAGCPGDLF
jgi:hypothetical protein